MNEPFTIDTLGNLDDGVVRKLVDKALEEALTDCDNRPGLEKARKVAITIQFLPVLDDRNAMKGVRATAQVKTSLPPRAANDDYLPTSIQGDHVKAFLPDSRQDAMFGAAEPQGDN